MSALYEMNRIIKNSKFISEKKKEEYTQKVTLKQTDPTVDFLRGIFNGKV